MEADEEQQGVRRSSRCGAGKGGHVDQLQRTEDAIMPQKRKHQETVDFSALSGNESSPLSEISETVMMMPFLLTSFIRPYIAKAIQREEKNL